MAASTTKRDYYEVLGVAREGTAVDLKTAYQKLARYDRFGHGGNPFEGFGGFSSSNLNEVLGEIFGDIFGATRSRRGGRTRGADLRYNLCLLYTSPSPRDS